MQDCISVTLRSVRALRHTVLTEIVCKCIIRTVLEAGIGQILSEIGLRTDFNTSLSGGVSESLNRYCVLALVSTKSTVVISITYHTCRSDKSNAGWSACTSDIFSIGVDFHRTDLSAECSCGISPISNFTHWYTGLVKLASKVSSRAGGSTDMQKHICVESLVDWTLVHAFSCGVLGKRTRRTGCHTKIG